MKVLNSIRGRLFAWLFAFIFLLLIGIGISLHYKVKKVMFEAIDRSLNSKIGIVAGLLHVEEGRIEFELSEFTSGEYAVPRSGLYYKVLMDGDLFSASPSLADDNFDFRLHMREINTEGVGDIAFTSTGPDNEPVRVMQHDFEFMGRPATIYLAESIEEELFAVEEIRLFLLITVPASIIFAGFISLWIVNQSLSPLHIFSRKVNLISHKNLDERIDSSIQTEELQKLAESFNNMLYRLQKAFEVERRIISDASHELKTPLSVIRTQCEVILQKSRTADEYVEALETIKSSGLHMNRLVKNLLSLARLDSGLLEPSRFEKVSINECIDEVANVARILAEKKQTRISTAVENGIEVMGSRDKLTEAFLNIVENGVRYGGEQGPVEVAARKDGHMVTITIRDHGPGIDEKDLDRVFERFYRADASRSSEGTGLGLSIAKAVIEAHGGEIRVQSRAGEGSSFIITLPADQHV